MKGPDGLCTDCGGTHDLWHAEDPAEWEYREGCACYLCQEQERKMNDNPRDKQFQNFAKLLMDELFYNNERTYTDQSNGYWCGESREIISRRAYDLAFHAVDNSRANDMEDWETERIMPYVPDMTELPKEQDASETTS